MKQSVIRLLKDNAVRAANRGDAMTVAQVIETGLLLAARLLCSIVAAQASSNGDAQASTGKHCLGSTHAKLVVREAVIGQTKPLGVENDLGFGICSPLIREPGLLFDYTNIQGGFLFYLSPVYAQEGVYFSISPLSILELNTRVAWVAMWPFPMNGAGYYPLEGYKSNYRESNLPADEAGSAHGFTAAAEAVLQGQVGLTSYVRLIVQNGFGLEYWKLGTAPFHYNVRNGVALARSDYMFSNRASILMGINLSDRFDLKVGANDELTLVPAGSYYKNIVGGLVILSLKVRPTTGSEVGLFLRVGAYTEHPFLTGLQVGGGLYATFEALRFNKQRSAQ